MIEVVFILPAIENSRELSKAKSRHVGVRGNLLTPRTTNRSLSGFRRKPRTTFVPRCLCPFVPFLTYSIRYDVTEKKRKRQKEVGQVGQAGVYGVLFTAISGFCRDTRLLSPVRMDKQYLMSVPLLPKRSGTQVGQQWDKWDS